MKNLTALLRKHVPLARIPLSNGGWNFVAKKRVAFDAAILAYKFLNLCKTDDVGTLERCMDDLLVKCVRFEVEPFLVLDGKDPPLKAKEVQKRASARKKATDRGAAVSLQPRKRHFQAMARMCQRHGATVVHAPEEAELMCAQLVKQGECDLVISNDSDCLAAGASIVCRFDSSQAHYIDLPTALSAMTSKKHADRPFDEVAMAHMCVMLGNDFCSNIPRVGPQGVWKLFVEQGARTIDEAIAKGRTAKDARFDLSKTKEIESAKDDVLRIFLTGRQCDEIETHEDGRGDELSCTHA